MKKRFKEFNTPQYLGLLGGILVILTAHMPNRIKIGCLIIGIVLSFEELIRYCVLKRPLRHKLMILGGINFTIPFLLILLIENYWLKYYKYLVYLYIWVGFSFSIFYLSLMIWVWINRPEARKSIIILHGILLICVIMLIISLLLM